MGETLRPGGLNLTEKALSFCAFPMESRILDMGCGRGGTLRCLQNHALQGLGIDASFLQLQQVDRSFPVVQAQGEAVPIVSEAMDAVLAECTLSIMADLPKVLNEIRRLLSPGGKLIFSDLYARNEAAMPLFRSLDMACSLGGIKTQQEITMALQTAGFEIELWEDCSDLLKYLTAQLIPAYGSMQAFWRSGAAPSTQEKMGDALDLQIIISKIKPGYYLAIAHKV